MIRFIADIGSNHNQNLGRANELIYQAKEAGCWGVKFQMFNGEIGKPEREWLNPDWLDPLSKQAHYYGMQFGCSPFYLEAVKILEPYVDFYKIAASQVNNLPLIKACAKTDKAIIISVPVDWPSSIAQLVEYAIWLRSPTWLSSTIRDLTLLHCVPKYPTLPRECNLEWMVVIRNAYGHRGPGYSDHTRNPGVIYRVVHHYGAQVVEFHLDLDGQGWEYHYGHCWLPEEIKEVIKNVKEGFEAD